MSTFDYCSVYNSRMPHQTIEKQRTANIAESELPTAAAEYAAAASRASTAAAVSEHRIAAASAASERARAAAALAEAPQI